MAKDIFKELEHKLSTENLTREEKTHLIQQSGEAYNREIDRELNRTLTKQYAGAALEIGSAAIPTGSGLRLSGKFLAPFGKQLLSSKPVQQLIGKSLNKGINSALTSLEQGTLTNLPLIPKSIQSKFGRKIPNDVLTSSIGGSVSGSIYGFGRGMLEGDNPITTAIQDLVLGAGIGGVLGGFTGHLDKTALGNKLNAYKALEKPTKFEKKQHMNNVNNYYKFYEQGVKTHREDLGNIKLPSYGMSETNRQKLDKAAEVVDLSKNLRQAKYIGEEPSIHEHNNFDIQKFHRLSDGRNDYLVTENSKNSHYFYKITDSTLKGPEPQGWNPNNIIPDFLTGYNSPERLNPRATVGIESLSNLPEFYKTTQSSINAYILGNTSDSSSTQNINNSIPFQTSSTHHAPSSTMLQGGVEYIWDTKNKSETPTGYASPITSESVFTPEQIGNMSSSEFAQNESAIMSQLQQGLIGNPETDLLNKYLGYTNPLTGTNKIYSAEDIGNLSGSEFSQLEPEINAQWGSIGIPTHNELSSAVGSGGAVYVSGYTRSDGTEVKGYYRSR